MYNGGYLKVYRALSLLFIVVSIGVIGFMMTSKLTFIDALYMTIITMSTVGFGEVTPLSTEARTFTIVLILMSVSIFGYTISVFTELLLSGQVIKQLKMKKVHKDIAKLKNHIIVCGYGRNGRQAVLKLQDYNRKVVVVEQHKEVLEELEHKKILTIDGDSTSDEALIQAGITNASTLITALPSDADNLFVVLTARQLNKNCKIISRASSESSYKKLKFAGANNVIMPDKLGGGHMASLVVTPDVIEFVDRLTIEGELDTNLKEISVNNLSEEYIGKTILDLDLRKRTGCTVIGFKNKKGQYVINPEANTKLKKDTYLILLGRSEQIDRLKDVF